MTIGEYIQLAAETKINESMISNAEQVYKTNFPDDIKRFISSSKEGTFLNNNFRALAFSEIIAAENDMHVDFVSKKLIPLFDCFDNDFIVYDFGSSHWAKFNIVDECLFKIKQDIEEVI